MSERSADDDAPRPRKGRRMLVTVVILLLLGAVAGCFLRAAATAEPPANLGVTDGRLAPCPSSPNCVSTQADDDDHAMEPVAFAGRPADAMKAVVSSLRQIDRLTIVEQCDDYIHCEVRSRLFRFCDDLEVYLDASASLIHFRSASRSGYSDLGVNRNRMEAFHSRLVRLLSDVK